MATNLIKEKIELPLKIGFFRRVFLRKKYPKADENTAIILSKAEPPEKYKKLESPSGIRWRDYNSYCIVDTAEKDITLNIHSPSIELVYDFDINLEVKCKIKEPIFIVENNVTNLEYHLEKQLMKAIQGITLKHKYCDICSARSELDSEIQNFIDEINKQNNLNVEILTLYIKIDQEYIQHLRALQQLEFNSQIQRAKFFYDRSYHYKLKENVEKDLSEKSNSLLVEDFINENEKGRDLVTAAVDVEMNGYDKKLGLFRRAKDEGVLVGGINEYIEEYFRSSLEKERANQQGAKKKKDNNCENAKVSTEGDPMITKTEDKSERPIHEQETSSPTGVKIGD